MTTPSNPSTDRTTSAEALEQAAACGEAAVYLARLGCARDAGLWARSAVWWAHYAVERERESRTPEEPRGGETQDDLA